MEPDGVVYLVGAGPGDPKLITLRGLECLREADVVVYDRLVSPALLEHCRPEARRVYAGKEPGRHAMTQEQINALLVREAEAGKRVCRLKGGDPFVFGRGGEEVEALAAAGIAFEVVPGVTAAVGASAYAGIPLTHRGVARSVAFLTGHHREDGADPDDLAAVCADTLVIYMGVETLPGIVERLLDEGRSPETPVAVVTRATTPRQKVLTGTLRTIVDEYGARGVEPPAVVIVGEVVRLRERAAWFGVK